MGGLEQLYQQVILDHAKEKHGRGLREADGLPRRELAEGIRCVKHDRAVTIPSDLADRLFGNRSREQAIEIHRHQHHAMRGHAFEIGRDQILGDDRGIRGRHAGSTENGGDSLRKRTRADRELIVCCRRRRHQRASSSFVYQLGLIG